MKKHFPVSPSFFKQRVRQLKKEKSLTQHQALDEAAKELGYSNYVNYRSNSQIKSKKSKPSMEDFFKRISLESDLSKKVELAILLIKNSKISFQNLLKILKQFKSSKKVMLRLCEEANLIKDIHSFLLDDLRSDEGGEIEMYAPNFIVAEVSLSNFVFTIKSEILYVECDYDLRLEFKSEVPKKFRNYPHFKVRSMFGSFELTIDKNKKITIEHSDIGHEW